MLHLRAFGAGPVMEEVATSVSALLGADHITRADAGDRSGRALVTADVNPEAAGVGEIGKASGALAVLGTNVAMLLVGGSLTLVVQRALARRAGGRDAVPAR